MSPSSLRLFFNTVRIRGTLALSLIMLALSVLYCLGSLFPLFAGYSSSYLILASFFSAYDFMLQAISSLLPLGIIIWISLCFLFIIINHKHWRAVLTCLILAPVFCFGGTIFGGLRLQLKNAGSVNYHSNSYHLNYIYDGGDGLGYYDLLECNPIGLSCKQIYTSLRRYPKIDKNAKVMIDAATKEISVTVEDKMLFSQLLE